MTDPEESNAVYFGAAAALGLALATIAFVAWQAATTERPPPDDAAVPIKVDAGALPFGNLRWEYDDPRPTPILTVGWNQSGLRGLVALEEGLHVVMREPAPEDDEAGRGDEEAVYALRPISAEEIGEPIAIHGGELGRVLSGSPRPWVVHTEPAVRARELGGDDPEGTLVWEPSEEEEVEAQDWWVVEGSMAGGALTKRRILTGPLPTAVELWWNPVGVRGRAVQISRQAFPLERELEAALVVGSAAGAALLLFDRPGSAPLDGPSGTRAFELEVVRFDARGAELWRRRTELDGYPHDPVARLDADGTLEAAWTAEGPEARVVTLSADGPQPRRRVPLEGRLNEHGLRLFRCGGQSWLFDIETPRSSRTLTRRPIEETSLGEVEAIYTATLSHDGAPPVRSGARGHDQWVDAYNNAHVHVALACNEGAVAAALDLPTRPTTQQRGIVFLQMP